MTQPLPIAYFLDRQTHFFALDNSWFSSAEAQRAAPFQQAIFSGAVVNPSEQRRATHWAPRFAAHPSCYQNVQANWNEQTQLEIQKAQSVETKVRRWVDQVNEGEITNPDGQPYQSIIHLGIGGSDVGPRLLHSVFSSLGLGKTAQGTHGPLKLRFAASVDFHELQAALHGLNPKTTLVLVASKTFTTQETLCNAQYVFDWIKREAGAHYLKAAKVAITCHPTKALDMGFPPEQVFELSQNIGGRFSIWGPVSLAIRLVYGHGPFDEFLQGGAEMDRHTLETPTPAKNLPTTLALCDYANLKHGVHSLMLSPYDARLGLLVPYLQQLWMESLGKGVTQNGEPLDKTPCPILWGGLGTSSQHAFFQMLHQAKHSCAIELLAVKTPGHSEVSLHHKLLANCLAQAEGFYVGQAAEELGSAHLACPGKRPTSSAVLELLSPHSLGHLIALWEHRTTALAALQNINPFDQWGVELGKQIATTVEASLSNPSKPISDPITQKIIQQLTQKS